MAWFRRRSKPTTSMQESFVPIKGLVAYTAEMIEKYGADASKWPIQAVVAYVEYMQQM